LHKANNYHLFKERAQDLDEGIVECTRKVQQVAIADEEEEEAAADDDDLPDLEPAPGRRKEDMWITAFGKICQKLPK